MIGIGVAAAGPPDWAGAAGCCAAAGAMAQHMPSAASSRPLRLEMNPVM
jgi:hypothetical protein